MGSSLYWSIPCLSTGLAGPYLANSSPSSFSLVIRCLRLFTLARSRMVSFTEASTVVSNRNCSRSDLCDNRHMDFRFPAPRQG